MDATTFFLTYSQAPIETAVVKAHLRTVKPILWIRVAQELHAAVEGEAERGRHVHVAVKFTDRVRTRGSIRIFDITVGDTTYHPNIKSPRSIKTVLEYCAKDGDYEDEGPIPTFVGSESKYDDLVALAKSGSRPNFDRAALQASISLLWANHIWVLYNRASTVRDPTGGTECVQLQQLQYDAGSVVIVGPTGCGKSTWAKRVAPKPSLMVCHIDDLKKFDPAVHQSVIFDDMSFKHMPREAQIHIVDQYDVRSIHCRHHCATIPAFTPKIFTANSYPFEDDPAIARRVRVINIITLVI